VIVRGHGKGKEGGRKRERRPIKANVKERMQPTMAREARARQQPTDSNSAPQALPVKIIVIDR
jgi:hypothetical protein